MSGIKLDIVTAERAVYSEEVDIVIAPGVEGQLGILPHHSPLMFIWFVLFIIVSCTLGNNRLFQHRL